MSPMTAVPMVSVAACSSMSAPQWSVHAVPSAATVSAIRTRTSRLASASQIAAAPDALRTRHRAAISSVSGRSASAARPARATAAIACPVSNLPSQRAQERHQVFLLVGRELDAEHEVEELHGVVEREQRVSGSNALCGSPISIIANAPAPRSSPSPIPVTRSRTRAACAQRTDATHRAALARRTRFALSDRS